MNRSRKNNVIFALILSMLFSLISPVTYTYGASKPTLSSKTVHIKVKKKKTIKVNCSVKGSISVKSLNPYFVSVKKSKTTINKKSPAVFEVKGKCVGYAIIAVTVKLKKAIKKKKTYELRLNVYVDESPQATSTPTVSPSASPVMTATPTASASPSASPSVSPSASPSPGASPSPSASPTPSPSASPTPVPTDPYNYTVTFTSGVTGDAGVTGMPDPVVVKVPKGGDQKLPLPAAPKRLGYVFDSWIYKNDYRKNPGTVVTVDKDMTIRAYWTRVIGPIVDYLPGAAGYENIRGLPNGKALGTDTSYTLSTIVPSWAGHTFLGWCIQGYSEPIYQPGDTINGIYSNINLVAQWDRKEYS